MLMGNLIEPRCSKGGSVLWPGSRTNNAHVLPRFVRRLPVQGERAPTCGKWWTASSGFFAPVRRGGTFPSKEFGPWETMNTWFNQWSSDGTFDELVDRIKAA